MSFLFGEFRRLLSHPAVWAGVVLTALVMLWTWNGLALRQPPVRLVGAFVSLDNEGSTALLACALAVVLGLSGAAQYAGLGRTPYLRVRGVGALARSLGAVVPPAVATFVAVVLGQLLGWLLAPTVLRGGVASLGPRAQPGVRSWAEWMSPALPAHAPGWLPDVVSIVAFAVVAAGISAVGAATLRILRVAWPAGVLVLAFSTVGSLGFGVIGLPEEVSPWWVLTHHREWLLALLYGAGLIVMSGAIAYVSEFMEDRR